MSIDTYDTLAMVRRNALGHYDLAWIAELVRPIIAGSGASMAPRQVPPGTSSLVIGKRAAELTISYVNGPHVAIESSEIAEAYSADCAGSPARFELFGTDLDLELMNVHQILLEKLEATGDFVLFSGQAGLLMNDS